MNLLDAASSDFAPHERERSSRKRFIDDVREKYSLDVSAGGTPPRGTPHGTTLVEGGISTALSR